MTLRLLLSDQLCLAITSLTVSGSYRLAPRVNSVFKHETFPLMVSFAYPCFYIEASSSISTSIAISSTL